MTTTKTHHLVTDLLAYMEVLVAERDRDRDEIEMLRAALASALDDLIAARKLIAASKGP